MKRKLIAGCALGLLSTAASAQVTIYGRMDLSLAQLPGAPDRIELRNGSGSRLGFRGTEDLGGGLRAVFGLETRFNADTGVAGNPFWGGKSVVGLAGDFGTVTFGRDDNPATKIVQEEADPWAGTTVAGNGVIFDGDFGAASRWGDSITYRGTFGGFTVGAQFAERLARDSNPFNFALVYAAGPLYLGLGLEEPGNVNDRWTTAMARYDFGSFTLSGLVGNGKDPAGLGVKSWLVAGTAPIGKGEFRISYGQRKNEGVVDNYEQFGFGYHHSLSKRTRVYADLVTVKPVAANENKVGYNVGIRHAF
jgi:predicted porin